MGLKLIWAVVLHAEAHQHHFKYGGSMVRCVIPHPAFCAKLARIQRCCDASVLSRNFSPRTKRSKLKLKSGTFSPHLIPSLTMNCQLLFQPRPPRNQILLCFTLKPCPSNWSHFIRPLLSHGTCSIPSRGMPIGLPIQMRPTSLAQG